MRQAAVAFESTGAAAASCWRNRDDLGFDATAMPSFELEDLRHG